MHNYYLHLGSNVGNRAEMLQKAIEALGKTSAKIISQSAIYETEPWGVKDQESFLNMALLVKSELEPDFFYKKLDDIQRNLGKVQTIKWGPRVIDIDIIYCDNLIYHSETLSIPHPRRTERNFVLIPLMEISEEFIDPEHQITIEELYDQCEDTSEVFLYEDIKN
ncbi:MAG: 2-amino-4-hydroxy-6-hydroxymethyldihydropteridine diphosphokinase [Saprospiraceae bacterium]|nr:2-amino-4-hydroxy-6-hydroxymethyldihydropteridine diphosphokinase [Saprospiraceae bacterium]